MPQIREYGDARVSLPGAIRTPQYTPEQFGAAEGRALESLGGAISQTADLVAKRIDQENTSEVTAELARKQADLSLKLQETLRTANPGDKEVFENFNKSVDEEMAKVGEKASTLTARNFYRDASEKIKTQLYMTSEQGQAELSGAKAVQDYQTTLNSLSAAAAADPTAIGLQRELHAAAIENLVRTGSLPREKALKLQREGDQSIVKSSIRGWIELNPSYAKQKLKSKEYDSELGAEGIKQLMGEIDQAERAREIEEERRQRALEKARKAQQEQTQNDFLVKLTEGGLSTKDVLGSNLDAFGSGSKEQFLNMLRQANSSERALQTDPATMMALFNRIHLPDGDPKKLYDENELNDYFGRGLSLSDLHHLRDEMQGRKTTAGQVESDMKKQVMEIARGKLTKSNPLTGFRDPVGDEQMQKFMTFFFQEYQAERSKGTSSLDLLNPDSPKYLGRAIDQFTRTPQQIMRDLAPRRKTEDTGLAKQSAPEGANAATPIFKAKPVPARKPGESPQDYLKRLKESGQ
jgi:hypothetical protein